MARIYARTVRRDGMVTHAACGTQLGMVTQDPVLRAWWHGPAGTRIAAPTRSRAVNQLIYHHLLVAGCTAHPDVTVD